MRYPVSLLLLVASAVATPGSALGQASGPDAVLDDARLAPSRDRLEATLHGADRVRLPREWLLDKMAEGLAKHVPPPRIAAAVEHMLVRMRTTAHIVASVPGARGERRIALARATVDALSAGAPEASLRALVQEVLRQEPPTAVESSRRSMITVAELAEREFSGEAAAEAALRAYRAHRSRGLSHLLGRARRIGAGPPGVRDRRLLDLGARIAAGPAPQVQWGLDRASAVDRRGPPRDDGFDMGMDRGSSRMRGGP